MEQIEASSVFTIGEDGEYTDELINREIQFTASSQFVILIRGTKIAFLERYSYELGTMGVKSWRCMVPLAMPVDTSMGIENPRLASIMFRYRHLCDTSIPFPYSEEVDDKFLGKYFVLDLIDHFDACHELIMYVGSELPRVHVIE